MCAYARAAVSEPAKSRLTCVPRTGRMAVAYHLTSLLSTLCAWRSLTAVMFGGHWYAATRRKRAGMNRVTRHPPLDSAY